MNIFGTRGSLLLAFSLMGLSILSLANTSFAQDQEVPRPIVFPMSVEELEAQAGSPDRIPLGPIEMPPSTSALSWEFLGPQPILNEFWSGNADASGRVSSIAVHPNDPDTVYLAGAQGGVWKSTDGGLNWTPLTDQLSSLASGALAIDADNPDTVYYGTGEQHYCGDCFYGDGLFKTTDGGTNWTKIAMKTDVGSYIARVIAKPGSSILHVCSDRGYVRSADGGTSWTVILNPDWCNDMVQSRSPSAPSTLFAAFHSRGIYRSTDDGATWTQLTNGLPSSGFRRINLAISDSDPNVVYASFVNPSGGLFGMYKTTDGGSSWFQLLNTPNYLCTQGWYDNALAVSPTDPDTVYAGGVFPYCDDGGVIKSTDGGTSWTNVTRGVDLSQLHPDQHILVFGADGGLWVGNDGGVWKTLTGGSTWLNRNHTLGITQFYTVGLHPDDSDFLLGGTQDNGTARYQGTLAWPQVIGGDGGPAVVEWADPALYYTTYVRLNPVYRWRRPNMFQGIVTGPWGSDRADWANSPLIVDPNLPNTLLAGTFRVWQTTNSGGSWSFISPDLTGGSGVLRATAVAIDDSNTIYTGSSNGRVYVTSDGGATWNLRNTGLPGRAIPDIVLDTEDSLTAYLCVDNTAGGRVFQTSDGGITWTDITGDLPLGLRGMSLAIDFDTFTLYLGTDYGVYSSSSGGVNWVKESTDLPNVAVYNVRVDPVNGLVVAATHGRGMWRASTNALALARR